MAKCLSGLLVIISIFVCCQQRAVAQGEAIAGRTITGTVYFIGGRSPGRSLSFRLNINRISTPDEVNQLNSALKSGGQDELLKVLSKMRAGRVDIGNGVGIPANVIIGSAGEDGRTKLTVIYERNVRFGELRYGAPVEPAQTPSLFSVSAVVKPGVPFSTTNAEMPLCLALGSVFATGIPGKLKTSALFPPG